MRSIVAFAAALLLSPAMARAADLSGVWNLEATGARGGGAAMTCTLTRSANPGFCVIRGSAVREQRAGKQPTTC